MGFSTFVDFDEVFLIIMPKYFVRNLKHMEFRMSLFHPLFLNVDIMLSCDV